MAHFLSINSTVELNEIDKIFNSVKEYIVPQASFGKGSGSVPIRVIYISDLHLDSHLANAQIELSNKAKVINYIDGIVYRILDGYISNISSNGVTSQNERDLLLGHYYLFKKNHSDLSDDDFKALVASVIRGQESYKVESYLETCICLLGDLASDINLVKLFFQRMFFRLKYYDFRYWKQENLDRFGEQKSIRTKTRENVLDELKNQISNLRKRIRQVEVKTGKKNLYGYYSKKRNNNEIERLIKSNKNLPDYLYYLIINLKRLLNRQEEILKDVDFHESLDRICLNDYRYNKRHCPIFYVLGNHELSSYHQIEDAVKEYKDAMSQYNVTILQNETITFGNCVILGGCGFAKNNNRYNADTLIGPGFMSKNRKLEAVETDKFFSIYKSSLEQACKAKVPMVVLSHYAVSDWINESTSSRCYYFHGHNHQNSLTVTGEKHIYADNQIGYTSKDIYFKEVILGTAYNPFIEYEDGFYEISVEQYNDFYNYSGEFIKVRQICAYINNGEKLFLIKRNSFYGFFLIGKKNTKICFGGSTRIVSDITDIRYYYDAFTLMIYAYMQIMLPLRKYQEQIANEIKMLNISSFDAGNIHGTIVDIDYYHHIMINPFDGTVTFYYSPVFGIIKKFDSFDDLLLSVYEKKTDMLENKKREDLVKCVGRLPSNSILVKSKNEIEASVKHELERIDIKNSLYHFSSRVNQLQRLFTSNILRDWNDSLVTKYICNDEIKKYHIEDKKLSSYNLVQKHWKNLLLIDEDKINKTLVECALNKKRKCRFPYLDSKRMYGENFQFNPMPDEEIKKYIRHIPVNILKDSFDLFYRVLGYRVLLYFPLNLLEYDEINEILSGGYISNKEKIELVAHIPHEELTDDFIRSISGNVNLKSRPAYCSVELWKTIRKL